MDIEHLKLEIPITDLLEHYGWEWDIYGGGDKRKTLCPFHDDHNPSAVVDEFKGRFVCYACGVEGDIIDVVQQVEGFKTVKEAKDWLEETFLPM